MSFTVLMHADKRNIETNRISRTKNNLPCHISWNVFVHKYINIDFLKSKMTNMYVSDT